MAAPLNASATTIGALVSGSTFEIPAYQREYAWEQAQVAEFWSDLSGATTREQYFLGLIILTGEDERKQVVDGQQRLLTITLLAAALRHEALAIGRKALADRLYDTLLRSMDYDTDEVLPRIVLTDSRANRTLQSIIETGRAEEAYIASGSSSERMWSAYQTLKANLQKSNEEDLFRQLGIWAKFLNEKLYVAVFEHSDEAAAYSVFEVVNTRGRQLTTADLLKNYVLRSTAEELREARYEAWYDMAKQFEPSGAQNFVSFIRHVVNLRAGYILPKDLYNYIAGRGDFAGKKVPITVDTLMQQLQDNLPLYLQLVDPTIDGPASPETLDVVVALNELGVTAVRPLLLAIASTDHSDSALRQVLRLIIKRVVVGNLGASSVERKFAEAAHAIYASGSSQAGLSTLEDMDHLREDFVSQLTQRSYNRSVLTFIRRSIVQLSITPKATGTLQYLRPRQAPDEAWPDFGKEFWGSTLGNSILVDLEKRPPGASSWHGVKQDLLSHAVSGEKIDLLEPYESWSPAAVRDVGSALALVAADVWY